MRESQVVLACAAHHDESRTSVCRVRTSARQALASGRSALTSARCSQTWGRVDFGASCMGNGTSWPDVSSQILAVLRDSTDTPCHAGPTGKPPRLPHGQTMADLPHGQTTDEPELDARTSSRYVRIGARRAPTWAMDLCLYSYGLLIVPAPFDHRLYAPAASE